MNNNIRHYVRVTKIAVADNPQYHTLSKEDWKAGEHNDGSPFVDYWVEGYLFRPLEVGKSIEIIRKVRNGVPMEGFMITTPIQKFDGSIAETKNSKYAIDFIREESLD